jgi:hypothetical protein
MTLSAGSFRNEPQEENKKFQPGELTLHSNIKNFKRNTNEKVTYYHCRFL